ncbi:undecaprenyldiphospho-muramoylpentapeptide beta-N-acetylglucosaminyltransferase [Sphingomonas prati]|uniref:UDP-N-acetylglucosamine--N-acetylmuramyl-(pentapeptide) pyrophosphoryl-undecaprenol N-acetylglucosamine transferase n=1 Tax=Sphingomonas prati TaxID=1843237 RepID=A0A7W9BTP1_9SPHN|nr:undecaprenyldiphospho-muramoylpentapeptide beta-N-acetylglucosaminyltransferase [Sphingomonas prati]MBB5729922.1 UDP-N-acetylglucosamine--N-acetylmuramyl-(pentapeptide) pyrophosphoryl-undecaprenol N-acetylglucosamine transferase [Sphingomonas prati]GGE88476.1 UDP-N-acetylglucosamine--N-acetylmuramyl-(pentapeptide) pyrophosphoryl-undecaprenol N-acetylglucosamine transferase [Sphingomonas prati]
MTARRHFVLAAGGTGGHMVPAHALAAELMARGHGVALITDARGARIPGLFQGVETHLLPAGRLSGGPIGWLKAWRNIRAGRAMARTIYGKARPDAVIGFGGYPALPAVLAAFKAGIPAAVHEQNAVLGRVNRLLARKVAAIATSYPDVQRLPARYADKVTLVGNPVRAEVAALRDEPFPVLDADGVFRVLVTGGSQGASVLSEVVPDGLGMLPVALRRRLQVTQQCRPEDIDVVRAKYAELGIPADLATYLPDLPERLAWSHLVIARAGASTIAELTEAGRPAILVPLPGATDDHQSVNVREMVAAGAARSIAQARFTPVELAKQMQKLALEPGALENAARRARGCGRPDAVRDLADLVEQLAGGTLRTNKDETTDMMQTSGADA